MMREFTGWLLDLFEDPGGGIVLWFIAEEGQRIRLRQEFPVTFYAAGSDANLKALAAFLRAQSLPLQLTRTTRRDLYKTQLQPVLAVQTQPAHITALVRRAARRFPMLDFYDADIPLAIRYAARHDTFPLAHCRGVCEGDVLEDLQTLNTPWELSPQPVPLRALELELDRNPHYGEPQVLFARYAGREQRIQLRYTASSLLRLNTILNTYDPDLLLTTSGDTWLFPHLFALAEQEHIPLQLNREPKVRTSLTGASCTAGSRCCCTGAATSMQGTPCCGRIMSWRARWRWRVSRACPSRPPRAARRARAST